MGADVPAALTPHSVLDGADLEHAHEVVSNVINPHTLRIRGDRQRLKVRQFAAAVGDVMLTYLHYGTEVEISVLDPAPCVCIQFPLAGAAPVRCGRETILSSTKMAAVLARTDPLIMNLPAEAAHLIVRIELSALERHLRTLIHGPVREPIRMQLALGLHGIPGARWRAILDLLQADIAQRTHAAQSGARAGEASTAAIQDLVLNSLLLWHPNNYWERLARHEQAARAPYVRRAVEYAHAHLDGPLTVAVLARAGGVSVRALQQGFARDFGCSPSSYVRDLRLDRIHGELTAGDARDGVSVTDVALRWGFSHLGRFAQVYRERFGELPSATLRGSA